MLLRLPGQGNRELIAISATSTGYGKLHFESESTFGTKAGLSMHRHFDDQKFTDAYGLRSYSVIFIDPLEANAPETTPPRSLSLNRVSQFQPPSRRHHARKCQSVDPESISARAGSCGTCSTPPRSERWLARKARAAAQGLASAAWRRGWRAGTRRVAWMTGWRGRRRAG